MFDRFGPSGPNVSADVIRAYLDTNVFIVAFETTGENSDALRQLFKASESDRIELFTSELTLAEVLVFPERTRNYALKRAYMQTLIWSQTVQLVPVTREILIETTRYRAQVDQAGADKADRRNFLPDAVHAVTAIGNACSVFLANDKRLRLPVGITRVAPAAAEIQKLLSQT